MKIRTSELTAEILIDRCDIGDDLREQIRHIPSKASTVCLYTTPEEMKRAAISLKRHMASTSMVNPQVYELVLAELEYFAGLKK